MVDSGHEDLTSVDEGHLLSIRRKGHFIHFALGGDDLSLVLLAIGPNDHLYLLGIPFVLYRIKLAIVTEAEGASIRNAQIATGMSVQIGDGFRGAILGERPFENIEVPVPLAQEIEGICIRPYRIPVFALEIRELAIIVLMRVVKPDILGDRRRVMFPIWILIAFSILIKDLTVLVDDRFLGGYGAYHAVPSSSGGDAIKFTPDSMRIDRGLMVVEPSGGKNNSISVRGESTGPVVPRIVSQPLRGSTF